MAEERTLGLARAEDYTAEEPSKEELQRRMDEARDSISNTVTEIKETVANQVQAVKDTLDWREQFKRRPVVWSAAALGAGFCTGYCIASFAKGESDDYRSAIDRYGEESKDYASQALAGTAGPITTPGSMAPRQDNGHTRFRTRLLPKAHQHSCFRAGSRRGRKPWRRFCAGAFENSEDGRATSTDHVAAKLHRRLSSQRRKAAISST